MFANCALIESEVQSILTENDIDYLTPQGNSYEAQFKTLGFQMRDLVGKENDPEQSFIDTTIYAHLLLLQQNFTEAIAQVQKFNLDEINFSAFSYNYTNVIAIKQCAIAGTAHEALCQFPEALKAYQSAAILINDSISKSEEGLIWAEKLYYRFGMLAASTSWDDQRVTLAALHGYQKITSFISSSSASVASDSRSIQRRVSLLNIHFLYLSSVLQRNPEDVAIRKELQGVSKLFQTVLFQSKESVTEVVANTAIEQFVDALCQNWRKSVHFHSPLESVFEPKDVEETKTLLQVLRQASTKTFHSCAIMRHMVFVLSALRHYDEALNAFDTYTAYQEKARQISTKEDGENKATPETASVPQGDDDQAVVRVFAKAIDVIVHVKKDGIRARETADKLRGWLNEEIPEPTVNGDGMRRRVSRGHRRVASGVSGISGVSAVSSEKSGELSSGFALVWASIGRAYALYAAQATTAILHNQVYELAVSSYEKSVRYSPEDGQIYFDFALLLAENSYVSRALDVAREGLTVDSTHVLLWHLVGLLLAALEDYEKASQAVNNALKICSEKRDSNPSQLMSTEKSQYLQLKMTQVAIEEAAEGIDKALEMIPEVFVLYGVLHPAPPSSTLPEINKLEISKSKSQKNKTGNGLVRSLSRTASKRNAANSVPASKPRAAKPSSQADLLRVPHQNNKTSRADLVKLWLWTAGLYRRAELNKESEEAIMEAEKINGPSADTHVELGLLIGEHRPPLALSEFEAALELDRNNIRAIVALAKIVFDHSHSSFSNRVVLTQQAENEDFLKALGKAQNSKPAGMANGLKPGYSLNPDSAASEVQSEGAKPSGTYDSLFTSEKDQLAAVTRVQSLLDMVLESGTGFNCAEAWWLMSLIKERNGDYAGATKALWKSIALEESRSVRSYSVVDYEVTEVK